MANKSLINLIGCKFGKLTVIQYAGRYGSGNKSHWQCKCDCGNVINVGQNNLRRGISTQCRECANQKLRHPRNDLTGQIFGHLTVKEYVGNRKYRCMCDCGKETIVVQSSLVTKNTRSCGCCCIGFNGSQQEQAMCELVSDIYGATNILPVSHVGKYRPDCVLKYNGNIYDIEYDGSYWHDDNHDEKRNQYFIENGYRVLRFVCMTHTMTKTFVTEQQLTTAIQYMELNNLLQYKILLQ